MIPDRAMWPQYRKGLMLQDKTVSESIEAFTHRKEELEMPEPDDLPDWKINEIYKELAQQALFRQATLAASLGSSESTEQIP